MILTKEEANRLCSACVLEIIGCGCDGSLDDGCFLCTPEAHKRPACPADCPTRSKRKDVTP